MEESFLLVMASLNEMRKTATMTDVTITCGRQTFPAHSVVLCAASPVLSKILSSGKNVIYLEEVGSSIMETMLTSMYTGTIKNLSVENMRLLLHASVFLQLEHVYNWCCDGCIEQMSVGNSIEMWCIAQEFGNEKLKHYIILYIIENSFDVGRSAQLEILITKQVERLIENVSNVSENIGHQVRLILGRLEFDIQGRKKEADRMLSLIDFSNCGNMFLKCMREKDHLPKTSANIRKILAERSEQDQAASLTKVLRSGQTIFFFGRNNGKSVFQAYCPKWQVWSGVIELPFNLTEDVGTAVFGDVILFIGGGSYYWETPQSTSLKYRTHADVIKYRLQSQSAKYIAKLNNPRADIKTAILGGKVYAIGGYKTGQNCNFAERYDFHSSQWENLPPMRNAHRGPYVVGLKGFLYVFGGLQCSFVEKFDPKQNQWTQLTQLPGYSSNIWPLGTTWKDRILVKTTNSYNTFQFIQLDDERISYTISPMEYMNCNSKVMQICGEYEAEHATGVILADDMRKLFYFDPETKRSTVLPGKVNLSWVWYLTAKVSASEYAVSKAYTVAMVPN